MSRPKKGKIEKLVKRGDCFAKNNCQIEETSCNDCPFFKTSEQYNHECELVNLRLRRLGIIKQLDIATKYFKGVKVWM